MTGFLGRTVQKFKSLLFGGGGAGMDAGTIQDQVENSMRNCVVGEHAANVFSMSLKPSKPRAEGGLGLQPQNWHALLDKFKRHYLPQTPPYTKLNVDQALVDSTFDKDLATTCQKITLELMKAQ
jgi:hypothetical protein